MSILHLASVYKVLPQKHGVLVSFRDGSYSVETERTFCRVLAARAHPLHGSSVQLPEVGEQGIVAELDGGFLVWMGGIHYQSGNQIDPTPGMDLDIHDSGVIRRTLANGDFEVSHPSGARATVSQDGKAMPAPARTSSGAAPTAPAPHMALSHPAGGELHIDPAGNLTISGFKSVALTSPGGGSIAISAAGALTVGGFSSMTFQKGTAQFVMATILPWLATHTHAVTALGSPTGVPAQAPALTPALVCSPATFLGPVGV